jgi:hypothetical protein
MSEPETEQLRASDAEREQFAERLHAAVSEGRITLTEYGERVGAVYGARTYGELEPLVADLPSTGGTVQSAASGAGAALAKPGPDAPAPIQIWVGAIKRRGRWRVTANTALGVGLGPVKLDLRQAELAGRDVTVAVRCVVGAIKVWVPTGVRVEVTGTTAVGTRTVEENHLPADANVPTLRLHLDTGLGTVKVYRV